MKYPMMIQTLDQGSSFVFRCVAPVLIVSLLVMPFLIEYNSWGRVLILVAWQIGCFLLLLSIYDSTRFNWALRALCALIFLAYVWFLLDQLVPDPETSKPGAKSGIGLLLGALLVYFAVAHPCLKYALVGRRDRETADEEQSAFVGTSDGQRPEE